MRLPSVRRTVTVAPGRMLTVASNGVHAGPPAGALSRTRVRHALAPRQRSTTATCPPLTRILPSSTREAATRVTTGGVPTGGVPTGGVPTGAEVGGGEAADLVCSPGAWAVVKVWSGEVVVPALLVAVSVKW